MVSRTMMISASIPLNVLRGFDRLCRLMGKSRTATLADLMKAFVLKEGCKIEAESQLVELASKDCIKGSRSGLDEQLSSPTPKSPMMTGKRLERRFSDFMETGDKGDGVLK